ncbi:prostatic acid phosphatase-like isoform X1 [Heteronotia binoei]|uniref:prostatic acid phosphatase-like isoform X1 n=1 Tax=Heteronotia binoei TaxID=13085 RepID=UPI00292D1599|nr:prostatic acid phosphatase-like isoform X1 [Heteronotia binoei]
MRGTCQTSGSKSLYVSLLFLIFVLLESVSGRNLTFATLIYRHGDRSPIETYPNALHKESEWPQGFGQLTTLGMQQQHELGQYIKKRYSNFLSPTYKREEIYVQSTDVDRTIMSAQVNLAGLFPPSTSEMWNPQILWQPIPIYVIPKSFRPKLRYPIFDCPRYKKLLRETMASREFRDKIQPYRNFLKTIADHSGYDMRSLRNLYTFKVWNVQDTLLCESIHNYTLPTWATEDVKAKLEQLTVLSLSSLFGIYKREEKARLQGGLLVKNILENISNAAKYPGKRKMLIYSAHDTTLGALQMALNTYNEKLPPYAACQIFELYQEDTGEYTIEMYFRNDTSRDPYPITLPGCSFACPLQKFSDLVAPILVDNWENECRS